MGRRSLGVLVLVIFFGLILTGCPKKAALKDEPSAKAAVQRDAERERASKIEAEKREGEARQARITEAEEAQKRGEAQKELERSKDLERSMVAQKTPGIEGTVFGYMRELETEADENAFRLIIQAGYHPEESKKAFERLYDATKEEKIKVPYFYQSHPKVLTRIKNFEGLINDLAAKDKTALKGERNEEIYNQMVKNVLLDNPRLLFKLNNNLQLARGQIERYNRLYPDDYQGYDLLGEVNLLQAEEKKQEKNKSRRPPKEAKEINYIEEAVLAFTKAIDLNPDYSETYRNLGMLYYKNHNKEKSKPLFAKYLELNPKARDAGYIRGYMNE